MNKALDLTVAAVLLPILVVLSILAPVGKKRMLDLALALILLVVLAPVSIGIIIALYFTQRSIIFRQERLGREGRPFRLYKFVTMRPGADGWIVQNANDPRITRIGRLLRATALDEIPELINVLKGEMSIVGPRPMPRWEHDVCKATIAGWNGRLSVKPGLIGLAQLKCHRADNATKLEYDMQYIRRQSFGLDLKLIALGLLANLKAKWV
ncbi:MAG: sugar transferase [Candidatus Binatia bacterium]